MTKKELIALTAETATKNSGKRITKVDTAIVFDALMVAITQKIIEGEKITLEGVGSFNPIVHSEKTLRDFNGNLYTVPEKNGVRFKISPTFKENIEATPVVQ